MIPLRSCDLYPEIHPCFSVRDLQERLLLHAEDSDDEPTNIQTSHDTTGEQILFCQIFVIIIARDIYYYSNHNSYKISMPATRITDNQMSSEVFIGEKI